MSVDYEHIREISLTPFVADLDPNVSPPNPKYIFPLKYRPPHGQTLTTAHSLYVEFTGPTVTGASMAFVTWERDRQSGRWVAMPPSSAVHLTKLVAHGIQDADIFVQVLSVAGAGAATKLTVRVTEQGTNENLGYGSETVAGTVIANQGSPNTIANSWPVQVRRSTVSSVTSVAGAIATVTLLAANADRLKLLIVNDSVEIMYVKFGAAASLSSYSVLIDSFETYEDEIWQGIVTMIQGVASGFARITELTP